MVIQVEKFIETSNSKAGPGKVTLKEIQKHMLEHAPPSLRVRIPRSSLSYMLRKHMGYVYAYTKKKGALIKGEKRHARIRRFVIEMHPALKEQEKGRPTVGLCNHHGEPWVDVLSPRQNGAETCWLFASEAPYPEALTLTPPLEHLRWFSLVRSPQTHVLSMYFHCKESHDHRKYRGAMPGLGARGKVLCACTCRWGERSR